MGFAIVVESCEEASHPWRAADAMLALNPVALVMLGDDPYGNTALTWGAYTTTRHTTTSTVASVKERRHAMWAKPGARDIQARRRAGNLVISWAGEDDHIAADNWDATITQANDGGGPVGVSTQAEVNAVITVWGQAVRELGNALWDYPTAAQLATSNGDVPSNPAAVGTPMDPSTIPVVYHYLDFSPSGQLGGTFARVIVPDLIRYRSPIASTDDSDKRCLGAVQEAWFMAAVRDAWARGFAHIVVASSKKLFESDSTGRYGSGENGDGWGRYETERDRIFGTLHAEGIRLCNMSGDRHTPVAVRRTVATHGDAFDSLDVCACPTGVQNNADGQGDTTGQLWLRAAPDKYDSVFGAIEFDDDGYMRLSICNARTGSRRWTCRVAPRSNEPVYDAGRAAVVSATQY